MDGSLSGMDTSSFLALGANLEREEAALGIKSIPTNQFLLSLIGPFSPIFQPALSTRDSAD